MNRLFKQWKRDGSAGARFWGSKRGNVALITAFMLIPLTVALGTAYDFTMAESRQDQIDGMADIATLGGVTPTMMTKSNLVAQAYSKNLFTSQIATVNGVTYNVSDIDMTGSVDSGGTTVTRTMVINYKAASTNVFATLLGMPTFPLHGASTATSSAAPNIDFYLMLDTSPSMEIAATSTGIATMIANTQQESDNGSADTWPYGPPATLPGPPGPGPGLYDPTGGKFSAPPNGNGCAFGCHESTPSEGTYTVSGKAINCTAAGKYADGATIGATFPTTGRDNYDLSRCLGVTLRIDLVNTAAQNLMTTAATTETNNLAKYRMALFETAYNNQANPLNLYLLQPITSDLNLAKTQAATVQALEMCNNNHLACGDGNGDMDTNLDGNLTSMNTSGNAAYIPNPGNGTNNVGDTPQEVLFIVTDGQNDFSSSGRKYPPMDLSGAKCAAIRTRNIRIAVLYTVYMPLEESWYQSAVEPYLGYSNGAVPYINNSTVTDKLATAASACASPGLYYQVSTDGDISAALVHLFQEAIATARLLH
jgi:Flp pilus assembly protein TadG